MSMNFTKEENKQWVQCNLICRTGVFCEGEKQCTLLAKVLYKEELVKKINQETNKMKKAAIPKKATINK